MGPRSSMLCGVVYKHPSHSLLMSSAALLAFIRKYLARKTESYEFPSWSAVTRRLELKHDSLLWVVMPVPVHLWKKTTFCLRLLLPTMLLFSSPAADSRRGIAETAERRGSRTSSATAFKCHLHPMARRLSSPTQKAAILETPSTSNGAKGGKG